MNKLFTTITLLFVALGATAIPAKRGIWNTLKLADGKEVKAQLMGDEHLHYWMTDDGDKYVADGDIFVPADMERMTANALSRRAKVNAAGKSRMRKVAMGERTHYTGKKKGLVILVEFKSTAFKPANNLAKYKRLLNEEGYSEGNFRGSVTDYFKAQSNGLFEIDFDVVGPYKLSYNYSYYGQNDYNGDDQHPDEMVVEAIKAADSEVNFKDYDWDGDGQVDQVFIVYAGKGEADGGSSATVWPHMYQLSETNMQTSLDGVLIDTYACANEIDASNNIEGIGCFCHEFSHCLGYPDLYDTVGGNWGMGSWDLMCAGNYNGGTFCPAGYSAYEKWMAGWLEPIELSDKDMDVKGLKPMSQHGDAYIIYNDAKEDEYLLIENRQRTNWDAELPGRGLMITRVDFDADIWEFNIPNSILTASSPYVMYYDYPTNDHQRLTIFHADNTSSTYNESTDLYPYGSKDSLTNTSTPKAMFYNNTSSGSKMLNKGITKIRQNSDGTMDFHFRSTATESGQQTTPVDGLLFYESFNKCDGKGGNDGTWTTTIASAAIQTDNAGWDYLKGYGGYQCARFGNSSTLGIVTTPAISLGDGYAKLTFKAAGWNTDGTTLQLEVSNGATISPSTVELKPFEWSEYTCTIKGKGTTKLTYTPIQRFLLDEVRVVSIDPVTGINDIRSGRPSVSYYDLQGRLVEHPTKGIYIVNGKKIIVK